MRRVDLGECARLGDAGVGEHDVELAEVGFEAARELVHVGGDAHVGADADRVRPERGGRFGDALVVLAGDGDACAVLDEQLGRRAADAGGAAGDESGLAFESLHAGFLGGG